MSPNISTVRRSARSSASRKPRRHEGGLDVPAIRAFLTAQHLKNRTIVSADAAPLLHDVERLSGLAMIRHRFRTGEEHGTWIVPPQWDVKAAWLKDAQGVVIASYEEHPLFVAPYSRPGRYQVSKAELLQHLYVDPNEPGAFGYNWRLAFDPALRLKTWSLSLPRPRLKRLGEGPFQVSIEADVADGELLVGELVLPGEEPGTIAFVADYCHPGQVNDSLSGVAVFAQLMRMLAGRPSRRYTYKLLLVPETIGSAIYIAADPARMAAVRGAVFAEALGWGQAWYLKATRSADTYLDLLAAECRQVFPELRSGPFFGLIGNDELIFDSVQVGVPALSLQKFPYAGYHTSRDEPSRLRDEDLLHGFEILQHLVEVAERDRVCAFVHPVPFLMSRYGLFADDVYDPRRFVRNRAIVYDLLDGRRSLLAIARQLDVPFADVADYAERMRAHGLITDAARSPWEQGIDDSLKQALRAAAA